MRSVNEPPDSKITINLTVKLLSDRASDGLSDITDSLEL